MQEDSQTNAFIEIAIQLIHAHDPSKPQTRPSTHALQRERERRLEERKACMWVIGGQRNGERQSIKEEMRVWQGQCTTVEEPVLWCRLGEGDGIFRRRIARRVFWMRRNISKCRGYLRGGRCRQYRGQSHRGC